MSLIPPEKVGRLQAALHQGQRISRPTVTGLGAYVATLDDARRGRLEHRLRAAYLTGRPDGERSFVAVALSCRGLVPKT